MIALESLVARVDRLFPERADLASARERMRQPTPLDAVPTPGAVMPSGITIGTRVPYSPPSDESMPELQIPGYATREEVALELVRELRDVLGPEGSTKGFERLAKARALIAQFYDGQ